MAAFNGRSARNDRWCSTAAAARDGLCSTSPSACTAERSSCRPSRPPTRGPAGAAGSPRSACRGRAEWASWRPPRRQPMVTTWPPPGNGRVAPSADRAAERALREEVHEAVTRLLGERQLLTPGREDEERIRALIREHVAAYQRRAATTNVPVLADPEGVERRLFDGLLRLGLLQPFMDDPSIEEVICNGPQRIFVIQDGAKRLVPDLYFEDDEELRQLVKRLVGPLGRRLDEASPMVDARLPDGSRLNAAIPPATTRWCCLTIRKFILRANTLEQLVALGTLTGSAATFLDACVQAGVNILVSGPTGAGKTTMLNGLGACIASLDERIVTVEEVAELQLERQLPDCVA